MKSHALVMMSKYKCISVRVFKRPHCWTIHFTDTLFSLTTKRGPRVGSGVVRIDPSISWPDVEQCD